MKDLSYYGIKIIKIETSRKECQITSTITANEKINYQHMYQHQIEYDKK